MTGRLRIVVGGQFGSEGKGHVVAQLAQRDGLAGQARTTLVRVAGPNAGHTVYDYRGNPWALRQIPAACVTRTDAKLVIAQGSEIDPEVLRNEISSLEAAGFPIVNRLYIDSQATVITQADKEHEKVMDMHRNLGSTAKGIGAARASRLMRRAPTAAEALGMLVVFNTAGQLRADLIDGGDVIVEGTQGWGLGLHAGYYPFCTSSDCTAVDFLAMCGLSPWLVPSNKVEVWITLRTFPIRVAGNSGPLPGETTWGQLNQESGGHIVPEFTTVTKLRRRVAYFHDDTAHRAAVANGMGGGGDQVKIALTFLDYVDPSLYGETDIHNISSAGWSFIRRVENATNATVGLVTTGPKTAIWLQ